MLVPGMVVRFMDVPATDRNWVVLRVTQENLSEGVNAEAPGLYAFGGMWYGDDPLSHKSYGKITETDGRPFQVEAGAVADMPLEVLKSKVG